MTVDEKRLRELASAATPKFLARVDKSGDCWIWTGKISVHGYGIIVLPGKLEIGAHRVSYLIHRGDIPSGMFVCHRCDNPPCVNPDHLFVGSNLDNVADMTAKGRAKNQNTDATECKHGHPFTPVNTYVDKRGHRACKECVRRNSRQYQLRLREKRKASGHG